jgi:hypothetical protein
MTTQLCICPMTDVCYEARNYPDNECEHTGIHERLRNCNVTCQTYQGETGHRCRCHLIIMEGDDIIETQELRESS